MQLQKVNWEPFAMAQMAVFQFGGGCWIIVGTSLTFTNFSRLRCETFMFRGSRLRLLQLSDIYVSSYVLSQHRLAITLACCILHKECSQPIAPKLKGTSNLLKNVSRVFLFGISIKQCLACNNICKNSKNNIFCKLKRWVFNALQKHSTENSKQIFPEVKLQGLVPNSYTHVSVSDLYIPPTFSPPILLHECGNWERGRAV